MAFKKRNSSDTKPVFSEKKLDCNVLRNNLLDDDATTRRWAARDLVDCPGASLTLLEQLDVETELSVRQVIFTSLSVIGDSVAVEGLIKCLRSEDTTLRNEAIEIMKGLPEEVALVMPSLLSDPDPDVRIFSVNILESLQHPSVEQWLIDVIRDDQHINVCGTAVDLLGEVGTSSALSDLENLSLRFSEEPYIQFATKLAISRIRGE
ncbi:MAG: HEAT repeat protein [Thalassolituus sp.]|jgi:HEAT repeat protein